MLLCDKIPANKLLFTELSETRTISQVTVAAQQRAEAAYRRQRVAQERAEESAIWRAEMEVERARLLKEMSGEGSRRPSYCQEVEELGKGAPDECNVCLQKSITRSLDLSRSLMSRNACIQIYAQL